MFKRTLLVTIILLLCCAAGLIIHLFSFSEEDAVFYQKLVESTQHGEQDSDPRDIHTQQRDCLQKDFWWPSNGSLLHLRLSSRESELIFSYDDAHRSDIVEVMHDVSCMMQEALYYTTADGDAVVLEDGSFYLKSDYSPLPSSAVTARQKIRYFESDDASYSYRTQTIVASQVFFRVFSAPGHTLDDIASLPEDDGTGMHGIADSAEFFFEDGALHFKASRLKAEIQTPEAINGSTMEVSS